ncbi:MAG TPA: hypothetical protein PKI19_13880, partial [Elusimicrobiales bacterium]|nr:hypothetical protein [Elusimicrobiales bacterium]
MNPATRRDAGAPAPETPKAVCGGYTAAAMAAVSLLTAAVFFSSLSNRFVDWDDDLLLTGNPYFRGLDWAHIKWMFTSFLGGVYQPLSWLTYAADYSLWGMDPFGYHLTSLVLHALNAALFCLLSLRLLSLAWPEPEAGKDLTLAAGFAALVFAVHPLRV